MCGCLRELRHIHTLEMESFQCELIVSWEFKGNKSSLLGGDGGCIQIIGLRISSFNQSGFFIKTKWPWEPQSKTIKHLVYPANSFLEFSK